MLKQNLEMWEVNCLLDEAVCFDGEIEQVQAVGTHDNFIS